MKGNMAQKQRYLFAIVAMMLAINSFSQVKEYMVIEKQDNSTLKLNVSDIEQWYFQKEEAVFSVNENSISLKSDKGSSSSFQIVSNVEWSISGVPNWLEVSATKGSGNATISLKTLSENSSATEDRKATLSISNEVTKTTKIEVTQKAAGVIFNVTGTPVKLSSEEGAESLFAINTNIDFKIGNVPDWLVVTPTSGQNSKTIKVKALSANNSTSERTAQLSITTSSNIFGSYSVEVEQAAGKEKLPSGAVNAINTVSLSDGVAFSFEVAEDVVAYYVLIAPKSQINQMSDSQIKERLLKTERYTELYYFPVTGASASTDYTICSIGEKSNGGYGNISRSDIKTKSSNNQPYVAAELGFQSESRYYFKAEGKNHTGTFYYWFDKGSNLSQKGMSQIEIAYLMNYMLLSDSKKVEKARGAVIAQYGNLNQGDIQLAFQAWAKSSNGEFSGILNSLFEERPNSARQRTAPKQRRIVQTGLIISVKRVSEISDLVGNILITVIE